MLRRRAAATRSPAGLPTPGHRRGGAAALVAALALGLLHCGAQPSIRILGPENGAFLIAHEVVVTGGIANVPAAEPVASLRVNGISALPLSPGGNFSVTVPLDPGAIFNPVVAELTLESGRVVRDRITLVVGDGLDTGFVPDGDASPASVGMRFNESGLAQVAPVVEQLSAGAFDIGNLIAGENPILDDACVVESLGNCLYFATANVIEAGIGSFALVADSRTGLVRADVGVEDLFVEIDLQVRDLVALEITCGLEITTSATTLAGDFALEPLASDPSRVDVRQVGDLAVSLGGFAAEFISGTCTAPVIGDIIQLLVSPSQIEGLVRDGFATSLGDPDGDGPADSAIAAAIEASLGGVSIAGPIGEAIGVDFAADFSAIAEDPDGITFAAGAAITNPTPLAEAPDLQASYAVTEPFPVFGPLSPEQGAPYGLALALSTSAFNQLLKAQVEGGLLRADLGEFDLGQGGPPVPLTVGLLALFVPELGVYPPTRPVRIELRPELAPVLSGAPGPGGELAELRIAGLRVDVRFADDDSLLLGTVVDADVGVDLDFADGALGFALGEPGPDAIRVTLVENPRFVDEASVLSFLPGVFPLVLPTLGSALGSFPLPDFLGLSLEPVEISRAGDFLALFLDLAVEPVTRLENLALTDLSTGDFKLDGGFDQMEWRHRVAGQASASGVSANLKGMLGADACCTTGDRTASATAGYRVEFDVVGLPGDAWTLDVAHEILGAFSLEDEKVLEQDAGGRARFTTPVVATASVDGGAPLAFGFTPAPSQAENGVGCTPAILFCGAPDVPSGDQDVEFSGAATAQLSGTGDAHVVLEFSFGLESFSDSNAFFPAAGGDEIAIRLGKDETLGDGFDAGAYPGWGARNPALDGHRVQVDLTVAPAP